MYRLEDDKRFRIRFDYVDDFEPCPTTVTLLDEHVTLQEVAQLIYDVAQHPVRYMGEYLAGTAEDADRHKPPTR